ncbi:vacuolar protein sorting-associated protein [Anaeramoeba flamelloides]|uniref:Vacuolar protein sorting-associated protein n=1 Tax=Anaeramoeba flamelloides TaxID=1746091 RepID=A0ABQ8YS13_9EUKA|nr:vacuolar protein sorting-associated protein [Anaeramoeba flamelloides]
MFTSQDIDNYHKSLKPKNKKRNCNFNQSDQEELLILDECLEINFNGLEKCESEIIIPKVKNRTNNKLLDQIKPTHCDFSFEKLLEEATKLNQFNLEQEISSCKEFDDFTSKYIEKNSQTQEELVQEQEQEEEEKEEQEQEEEQEDGAFVEYFREIEKHLINKTNTNKGKLAFSPPKRNKNPILFDELFYSNLDFN